MKRNIFLTEAGLVMQLLLFWLGASPDRLICDKEYSDQPGLPETKCPSNNRNFSPADLLCNHSLYLQQNKIGEILLKKDHHFGYYTQVQMAMGLSQVNYCDHRIKLHLKCTSRGGVQGVWTPPFFQTDQSVPPTVASKVSRT